MTMEKDSKFKKLQSQLNKDCQSLASIQTHKWKNRRDKHGR